GEAFARQPVGSGPFKVESWDQGQQIVLIKNDAYREPNSPKVDKIIYRILPDASTRVIALESGQVDVLLDLPESEFGRLQSNQDIQLYAEPTLRTVFYLFSPEQVPFDDPAVREAFVLAVDRDALASSV